MNQPYFGMKYNHNLHWIRQVGLHVLHPAQLWGAATFPLILGSTTASPRAQHGSEPPQEVEQSSVGLLCAACGKGSYTNASFQPPILFPTDLPQHTHVQGQCNSLHHPPLLTKWCRYVLWYNCNTLGPAQVICISPIGQSESGKLLFLHS